MGSVQTFENDYLGKIENDPSECLRNAAPIRARKIVGLNGFAR